MKEKKIYDVTGVPLAPGHPDKCQGAKPETCCCDECEFFLSCFPEWDENGKEFIKLTTPTLGIK